MSGTNQAESVEVAPPAGVSPKRKRRGRRIALISIGSVFALIIVAAVGAYATVNHFASNVKRIPNVFTRLDSAHRPVLPAATAKSITILLTSSTTSDPTATGQGVKGASAAPLQPSNLIALVHFDADLKAASVVSIPGNTEVNIPGHGQSELQNALTFGGPALLIDTVQQLTDVPVDHYSVVSFDGVTKALRPLGGVDVTLPAATSSDGIAFHAGVNHLTADDALAYTRQASLTQEQRVQRQQALLRAIVAKFVTLDLIRNPLKDLSLLDAFTSAVSVDSDFSNSQLYHLAGDLHLLRAGSSTFVTAPVTGSAAYDSGVKLTPAAGQLWQAIRNDKVAMFATQHPAVVTPAAPN